MTPGPRPGRVWLVGAGPGDPGLLTVKAARVIAACDVLVHDGPAARTIVALAPPRGETIDVGAGARTAARSHEEVTALLVRLGLAGKRVVRLTDGDGFTFGRAAHEAAELRAAGVAFEIVPGLAAALAVPAYAGIPVTPGDRDAALAVAIAHEDPRAGYSSLDYAKLADPAQTLILLTQAGNLPGIAAKLREHGMPGDLPVAVVRDGTKPAQATLIATLGTVAGDAGRTSDAAVVVVIGNVVREREPLRWFDASPLFGKRVLVTRARGDADGFADRLLEIGAEPVIAPTIAIGPPDEPQPAREAAVTLGSRGWIVFTSRNGVDACFDLLRRDGGDARRFGTAKVAAIGPKTAERLTQYGIRPEFVPEDFVAEAVAAGLLARTAAGDRILVFGAQAMRDVLPRTLRGAGRNVDVVAAYKTSQVDDPGLARAAEETDIWTFTSASTVLGFVANVPGAGDLAQDRMVACIGPVTARAARDAGLEPDVVAERYTVDGLIEALEAAALAR